MCVYLYNLYGCARKRTLEQKYAEKVVSDLLNYAFGCRRVESGGMEIYFI